MAMQVTQFTEAPGVVHTLDDLRKYWDRKTPEVSDVVDKQGNQYVDLVMEGGGVLGVALLGYTYALESVGIRFLGVGGTSAGAIVATMIAALDKPGTAKSERALKLLANLDMFDCVDGDSDAKDFVETMLEGAGPVKLVWKGSQVMDNLFGDLGLNPGDYFLHWVAGKLKDVGIKTVADLQQRFQELPPGLRVRGETDELTPRKAAICLKIVDADVTTETKVVFPEMAKLYFRHPEELNPAHFVRASMSIPLFFQPYRVRDLPGGKTALRAWKKVGYEGPVPEEILFIDGGIMSNFPADLFHDPKRKGVPDAPTFGARLGMARDEPNGTDTPPELLMAIFNSARHCNDFDFLARNPDFKHLVTKIPTGPHNWLDFFLTPEAKVDLFTRGVKAAAAWLRTFDWHEYRQVRENLSKV